MVRKKGCDDADRRKAPGAPEPYFGNFRGIESDIRFAARIRATTERGLQMQPENRRGADAPK